MRSRPTIAHRLRTGLQRWLDVCPYTAQDFASVGERVLVDSCVYISDPSKVSLGDGCAIYRGCAIMTGPGSFMLGRRSHLAGSVFVNALQGGVFIGEGSAIGPYAVLLSYSNAILPGVLIDDARISSAVHIGNDVFIGAGVTILPGVRIGDHAVVGAGAVVRRDVEPGQVVGGIPSKAIGMRR